MKTINKLLFFVFGVAIFLINGCTDESRPSTSAILPKPEAQNIQLFVSAGEELQVILSSDSRFLILDGYYYARGIKGEIINLNNVKIQWEKKSGPSSYQIEHPNSIKTNVSNLEKGIYEFELTVTTENGLTAKDLVKYTVGSISDKSKEIIFENKIWLPIWYFNIEISDFNLLIPQTDFKVYIQRDNNTEWEEVKHYSENLTSKYDYFIETRPDGAGMYNYGSLYISHYALDAKDTPSVKIVF